MYDRSVFFLYRPKKDLKLTYRITYKMTGEKKGHIVLDSSLDIIASFTVIDINQSGHVSVRFSLEEGTFISNNIKKNFPYKGKSNLITLNHHGSVIKREDNIPYGILEFFNFSLPEEEIKTGFPWEGTCYNVFPNIKSPVEMRGSFRSVRFEGFKGYNCAHISLSMQPRFIMLTENVRQTLSGNGYILFDPDYSIFAFMSIDSMSDTGLPGLVFRSSFIQEISPSIKQERPVPADCSVTEEYFTRY
ncbi:MAG: hypothetical protein ABRQ38_12165 [Candidatus Eremiobacterota bacterium]